MTKKEKMDEKKEDKADESELNFAATYNIVDDLPISSCEAERSFATLRRIKNHMRTSMGQERIFALSLLDMHILIMEMDQLINAFASRKGREAYSF